MSPLQAVAVESRLYRVRRQISKQIYGLKRGPNPRLQSVQDRRAGGLKQLERLLRFVDQQLTEVQS